MSLNIYIRNGKPFPYQTPTNVSLEAIEQGGGSPLEKDLNTLAFLRSWAHSEFDPDELNGKDARNT